jgi:hypothetical protein
VPQGIPLDEAFGKNRARIGNAKPTTDARRRGEQPSVSGHLVIGSDLRKMTLKM